MSPKYGMPELYMVTNMISGAGIGLGGTTSGAASTTLIHESRVIRFDGNETDDITRQQLAGWTFSVLQTLYETLKKFEHSFDSTAGLLADASQAVFKIKGLLDAITSGNVGDLQTRMALVDASRSSIKSVLLDAEGGEEFTRVASNFTGIADLLDKWISRLCADADMPRSELFGESPGGLNANAAGETRKWYALIASLQTDELGPQIKRIINLISKAADSPISNKDADWQISFKPLWMPTDKEDADYRLAIAQGDAIYLAAGVVTPEQVALGRWGSGKFSPDIKVDADALQEAIDGKLMADPYENEPEPINPNADPATGQTASPESPLPVATGPKPAGNAARGKPMRKAPSSSPGN
jgi:uncharacterized protein